MGQYYRQPPRRPEGPHAVWNGLGCLMLIVVPAMSIALAILAVDLIVAENMPIPYQLLGYPRFPNFLYATPGLASIFGAIASVNNLYAYIVVSLIFILVLGGIVSMFYAAVYRLAGPSRYGPLDEPPLKIRTKTFKR